MPKGALKTLGRYEILGEIGRGSMGVVYKARDPLIGRLVAIKSLPESFGLAPDKREEFIKRLRQEALAAGRLQHPNIVTIFDVGETEEGPFIAMEFIEGHSLRELISRGKRPSLLQLVEIITPVAEALDYVRSKDIIHRDIKPANIMITRENRIKLMDLGISRLPHSDLTQEGKLVGSPSYMSPELLSGKKIDHRSDLFSLGVCIYQLMTLRKPFPGETIQEICYKIVHDDFPLPSSLNPELPPEFDDFMILALAKNPDERFQSGAEMVEALRRVAGLTDEESSFSHDATDISSLNTSLPNSRPEDPAERSSSSNPIFTQTSTLETLFQDLTYSSRITDLSRQQTPSPLPWKWILVAAVALAAAALILFVLIT